MNIILGIDVGGSTTKIVGFECNSAGDVLGFDSQHSKVLPEKIQVKAADQITSMYGSIGKFLSCQKIKLDDVSKIYLTGVGASFIDEDVYGIETLKVNEFQAIGFGALNVTNLDEALVVSMGTGTAFVKATKNHIEHIGGTGVGGGSILGLASLMLGKNDIDAILALAENGDIKNVDLTVRDIFGKEVKSLPSHLTAANFGKIKSTASESDIALGIINMVLETIGMLATFALKNETIKNVVLTGTLATFPQTKNVFKNFSDFTGINFIIPEEAIFVTALGACATSP
ncbi:MAG: type II pantothenate kinase [Oscillospiraceae bacterium]|jgi:type II pantothenate kinase|nr:type II pantothenate kinase [Oscillospiraceae bacterium]